MFAKLGRRVIQADEIARSIVDQDHSVQSRIRAAFGASVFLSSGHLDRKALARIVFSDSAMRKKLNAIVHPVVFTRIDQEIQRLSHETRIPFVVIEAALIYESGMERKLDYVLVINALEENRIRRVMHRDHLSRREVLQRMHAQMPAEAKRKKADFVVDNDGTEAELFSRIQFINTLISHMRTTP